MSSVHSWNWRKILQLRSVAYNFVENRNGVECWRFQGSKYSTALIWNELRPKKEKNEWSRLLWTSLSIPKYVIVSWMTVLNKLPTMDRMLEWGLEIDGKCRLCQDGMESRDHLFFGCSFAKEVWRSVL